MRIVLTIVLFLLLVSLSLAKHESSTMGPYMVTFDLNTTKEYRMDNTSKQGETYCGIKYQTYTITLSSKRNFMLITIAYFADKMSKDINDTQSGVEDFLQHSECQNIEIHDRTIDNQSGVLGVGENSNGDSVFAAQYWPTFDASCDTNVLIESNYPWANETLSLLKTIHIEQIGDSTNLIPR